MKRRLTKLVSSSERRSYILAVIRDDVTSVAAARGRVDTSLTTTFDSTAAEVLL